VNITLPPVVIINNVTTNVTIVKKARELNGPTRPLYGSIVIMILILIGIAAFMV
jgi:hypothetical protein